MKYYHIHLRVPTRLVTTLLELVEREDITVLDSPFKEAAIAPSSKRTPHYVNGKRNKGISGRDLVLASLKTSPSGLTDEELERIFTDRGFSPNSAGPNTSKLREEGVIWRSIGGKWLLRSSPPSSPFPPIPPVTGPKPKEIV
jgi:hypothetical protein